MKRIILSIIILITLFKCQAQSITDYDGNTYNTVIIGNQTWMKENLRTNHYNNGEAIPKITNDSAWTKLTSVAYCWYNNDSALHSHTYGALYNWVAVNIETNKNVCPLGWHVPSDNEWQILINYLGGNANAGGKMKETGFTHWQNPNTGATNTSNFTALLGGSRGGSEGSFGWMGLGNDYWSSTQENTVNAWARYLGNDIKACLRLNHDKINGFSVRCIKDESNNILNFNDEEIRISPNPFKNMILIELSAVLKHTISIFDSKGKLVFNNIFNDSKNEINT